MREDFLVLTEAETAAWIRMGLSTLRRKRRAGEGPPHLYVTARTVGYRVRDVEDWLAGRVHTASARRPKPLRRPQDEVAAPSRPDRACA